MKSCLKCSAASRSASYPGPSSRPRFNHRVSFRDKCEYEVHTADEWDRTPCDVAQKLSYDDILELKEMQVAAAKASARAAAASGMPSKYLSNVPLALLPLLPETNAASSSDSSPQPPTSSPPGSPPSLVNGNYGSSIGLAEACLCRVFSADTGVSPENANAHRQGHLPGRHSSDPGLGASPPQPKDQHQEATPQVKLNAIHQIPSPPDTPPRLPVTSIPPPPPTTRARNFAFLPLLDASTSPATSPTPTPSVSGISSPATSSQGPSMSAVPAASLSASLSALRSSASSLSSPSSPPSSSSSSSSSTLSPGAYTSYDPYCGTRGVGGSATLGLERKLGYKFVEDSESDSRSASSEEEEGEEKDWPRDWPGKHPQHHHGQHQHQHHRHRHTGSSHSSHRRKDKDKDVKEGMGLGIDGGTDACLRIGAKGKEAIINLTWVKGQLRQEQRSPSLSSSPSPSMSPLSLSSPPKLPPSPPLEPRPLPYSCPHSHCSSSPSPRSPGSGSPRASSHKYSASSGGTSTGSPLRSPSSPPPSSPGRTRKSKTALPFVTLA